MQNIWTSKTFRKSFIDFLFGKFLEILPKNMFLKSSSNKQFSEHFIDVIFLENFFRHCFLWIFFENSIDDVFSESFLKNIGRKKSEHFPEQRLDNCLICCIEIVSFFARCSGNFLQLEKVGAFSFRKENGKHLSTKEIVKSCERKRKSRKFCRQRGILRTPWITIFWEKTPFKTKFQQSTLGKNYLGSVLKTSAKPVLTKNTLDTAC